jgi:predicted methyltransferase
MSRAYIDSNDPMDPLLTSMLHAALLAARDAGQRQLRCSLDLGKSTTNVDPDTADWRWGDRSYPYLPDCKERTVYYWAGASFQPVSRFTTSLIKLVPTEWGPPTFEIDGIKMLPTARVSPYADAERKVGLVDPRGRRILDTCGGLGYFAGCCLAAGAARVLSFELNPDVIWLRSLNPWSPDNRWSVPGSDALTLVNADICERIVTMAAESVDAILHDPPRFGTAGELYSQQFYDHLARVIKRAGKLFHYTGTPNKLTSGRNVAREVSIRLQRAGFTVEPNGDGLLAKKTGRGAGR